MNVDWAEVDWGTLGLIVVGVATAVVYWMIYRLNERQNKRQAESDVRVETIQRRQADALEQMAKALIERMDQNIPTVDQVLQQMEQGRMPTVDQVLQQVEQGATLSARFEKAGRGDRLVVKNQGPGPAQVISVEVLNNPNLLVEPLGLDDLQLLMGEEHRIIAALHLGMSLPVKLRMTWIDSRGVQSREQTLNSF